MDDQSLNQSDSITPNVAPQNTYSQPVNNQSVSTGEHDKLLYKTLLENIGEGLLVTDKNGQIITFNKAAVSMLGWSENEAIGKPMHEIINANYKNIDDSKAKFGSQTSLSFIRRDGTKFPVAITATSYSQGSEILGTITLFRDITVEQNIDAIKNEFISLASHQLRTPLSAIKWYSHLLINNDAGQLLPTQFECAKGIYDSTERMIQLVNDLLNISRVESGRLSVEPVKTDLKKLVEETIQEVKIHFKEKGQVFDFSIPDNFLQINIDPQLVRQIYLNLLTNAAKYTPNGGKISITILQKDDDIVSEVKDNGYGIPEDDKSHLFDKFFRASNIISKVSDGTGLGLYLIKAIIGLSDGKIWFESKPDHGTTFWFSLPIAGTTPKKGVVRLDS